MTIDPQWIRVERHSAVGSVLLRDAEMIVERWCIRARQEQPQARRAHQDVLRDHLLGLLQAIGRTLSESEMRNTFSHCESAVEHGEQRWQAGWSLSEVVRDYQILRLVVLEYLEDTLERNSTLHETLALNLSLDEAISASINSYVAQREAYVREIETTHERHADSAKQSLAQWELLFRHAGWGVAMVDPTSQHVLLANPAFAAIHGQASPDIVGKPIHALATPDAADEWTARLKECCASGHVLFESRHRHAYGEEFPIQVDLALYSTDGQGTRVAVNVQDISARKQVENLLAERADELLDADRRKDEFLATLAHELRNPLSPLWHAVESLRLPGMDETMLSQTRDVMERQVKLLVRLVDDLLDVARIRQGKIDLRKRTVDLSEIVAAAVESVRPLLDAGDHELCVTMPGAPALLEVDPGRIEQVLCNLLNNAGKFSDPGRRIHFSAGLDGDRAVIKVRDEGIGIDPQALPRIFNVFEQVNPGFDNRYGGLGIGLSLVRSFVELHGGSVVAESRGIGQGSSFTIYLPCNGAVAPPPEPESPATNHRTQSLKLLIVDDNHDVAELLAVLMSRIGHNVSLAHDGPQALEAAQSYLPDVVLLDIGLPGMNGYDVARRLREPVSDRPVALVAMTGYGREEDKERSREAGFDYHLVKPVSLASLQSVLQDIVSKRGH